MLSIVIQLRSGDIAIYNTYYEYYITVSCG